MYGRRMSIHNRILCCFVLISGLAVAPPGQAETPEFLDKKAEKLAGDILKAVRQRDFAFFVRLVPAGELQNYRLPDDLANFLFSISDVAMWYETDPCESTVQPIKSVSEIVLDAPDDIVFRVVKESRGQGLTLGYRIYYYDLDYLDPVHAPPETVSRYQMRCFVSTYVEFTGDKWQAPDLFDFSRYKDRFLNRIPARQRHIAETYEEVRVVASELFEAITHRDRESVDRFLTAEQRKESGEGTTFDRYLYELSDANLLTEGDACESTTVSIRSVWEILEWFPFAVDWQIDPLPDAARGEEAYRIYFSYGHDTFYRGTPSEAPDPYELTLPLAPVLKQYQMRCYASTELIKGEHGWYSPDLFDYSLFKERFERRDLK